MRALLLAAGLGSRLRPLTDVLPKCLAPIRGRPLVEYWLELLSGANAEEVIINAHHHARLVVEYVNGTPWRDNIRVVEEPELLGTGGTIAANAGTPTSGPLFVAHADNLSLFWYGDFARSHANRPKQCVMTMMTFMTSQPRASGVVTLDEQGIVSGFYEKVPDPPGNLANAAVYILERDVLEFALSIRTKFIDFSTEVIPHFLGRIWTFHNSTYHEDIGTLDRWRRAQITFSGRPPAMLRNDPWASLLRRHPEIPATIGSLLSPA